MTPITMRIARVNANETFSFALASLDDLPRGPIGAAELADILSGEADEYTRTSSPKLKEQIGEAVEGVIRAALIGDGMSPGKSRITANAIVNYGLGSHAEAALLAQRILAAVHQ